MKVIQNLMLAVLVVLPVGSFASAGPLTYATSCVVFRENLNANASWDAIAKDVITNAPSKEKCKADILIKEDNLQIRFTDVFTEYRLTDDELLPRNIVYVVGRGYLEVINSNTGEVFSADETSAQSFNLNKEIDTVIDSASLRLKITDHSSQNPKTYIVMCKTAVKN